MSETIADLDGLWEFLAHGSDAHKQWLYDALVAWNKGEPRPEPYE